MAGLNDRRRLGTESGRIRREARAVARAGGNPSELLNRAANTKLGEGSAISSSEENIAFEEQKRRTQSGLMESKRRATLGGGTSRTGQTPAGVAENLSPEESGTALPQRTTNASLNATRPGETTAQAQTRFRESRTGVATAPVGEAGTSNQGPPRSAMVPPIGSTPRPTLMGPPKPGLIDGKPARSVIDSMRGSDTEPGNLAGLADRDAKDRESAITAARTESAGNPSVTRGSVVDRINKERTAKGLQPFGEDIYKDIAKQDSEAAKQTPLQKSLMEARTRFAPVPENTSSGFQGGLPVPAPLDTSDLQVPPSLFGGLPPESTKPVSVQGPPISAKPPGLAARFDTRLNARFSAGPLTQRPTVKADRTAEEEDYKKRYKATPDLPVAPSDSLANRLFKSTLTRYTR